MSAFDPKRTLPSADLTTADETALRCPSRTMISAAVHLFDL